VKTLTLRVTQSRGIYLVRAEGEARNAWDGSDVVGIGTMGEILTDMRCLIDAEFPPAYAAPAPPPRPVAVPDPVPGAAK